jgi:hypothetical protein
MTHRSFRKSAVPIAIFSLVAISSVAGALWKFPLQKPGIPIKARS